MIIFAGVSCIASVLLPLCMFLILLRFQPLWVGRMATAYAPARNLQHLSHGLADTDLHRLRPA